MSQSDRSGQFATVVLLLVAIPLAVIWIWDISAKHALNTQDTNATTREYAKDAEQDIQRTSVASDPIVMTKCIQKIVEATEESKRAVKDLQAQKEMADWAFWMLMASIGTGAITGIGVWFVRDTLKATRESIEVVAKANEIARDGFFNEQRPWINVDVSEVVQIEVQENCIIFVATIDLQNIGNSPAFNVWYDFDVTIFPHKIRDENNPSGDVSPKSFPRLCSMIFPGKKLTTVQRFHSSIERAVFEESKWIIPRIPVSYEGFFVVFYSVNGLEYRQFTSIEFSLRIQAAADEMPPNSWVKRKATGKITLTHNGLKVGQKKQN